MAKEKLKHKGFSLAEAMLATVILAATAGSVLFPFTAGARLRVEGMHRTLGAELAGALMEKIVNTQYDQIITSYNGYAESIGQIKSMTGAILNTGNYNGFSRTASCASVYVAQESGTKPAKFILATVNVYYNGAEVASVGRLIGK